VLSKYRQRFGLKLFTTYLAVIFFGIIILAASSKLVIPLAFENHMSHMMEESMMGLMGGHMGADLYESFSHAFNEALTRAAIGAIFAAIGMSVLVTRRVIAPIREMKYASREIADGQYEQRVKVKSLPGDEDELDQLAISFNQMAEKLAQTENMRRKLIGDITHELRTPLTAIQGSLEGLMDGVLSPTDETFQLIHHEADRLKRLVDDLQELSRVEAHEFQLDLQPVSPSELVTSIIRRLSLQFKEKGVLLETDLSPDVPDIVIDEVRIEQVLLNLVGNALQYTPEGGKVCISTRYQDGEVTFMVSDTGIGIPSEHLPLVFTRFYRVDKSRSRIGGGSGIGLTIAKHLVEAHGGRITAASAGENLGSEFSFSIPV